MSRSSNDDARPPRRSGDGPISEPNQSVLGAVPSQFLNTSFPSLLSDTGAPSSPRYQIGESIGSGGIGDVYRVYDRMGQRHLALKTLQRKFHRNGAAIDRFHREGLLTGTLQHPGIPPVYDHGTLEDGTPFFSMKLVEGQTLQQLIEARSLMANALIGLGRREEAEHYLQATIELISSERGAKHKYALAAQKQLDALQAAD